MLIWNAWWLWTRAHLSDFVVLFVASVESRIQPKEKPEVYWQNRMYSCKSATDSPIIGGHRESGYWVLAQVSS